MIHNIGGKRGAKQNPPSPSCQLPVPYPETIQSGPLLSAPGAAASLNRYWPTFDGQGIEPQKEQDFCLKLHSKSEQKLDARKHVHFLLFLNP